MKETVSEYKNVRQRRFLHGYAVSASCFNHVNDDFSSDAQ